MKVTAGGKDTVGDMQRVVQSIPSSYTIWKDGTQAIAESNVKGGTDYTTGTDAVVTQNAIDALPSGGKIFFRGIGPYSLGNQLDVDYPIMFQGESRGRYGNTVTRLIFGTSSDGFVLDKTGTVTSFCGFRDLDIIGIGEGNIGITAIGDGTHTFQELLLDNVTFSQWNTSLNVQYADGVTVQNILSGSVNGVYLKEVNDYKMVSGRLEGTPATGSYGIKVEGLTSLSAALTLLGTFIRGFEIGLNLNVWEDINLIGVTSDGVTGTTKSCYIHDCINGRIMGGFYCAEANGTNGIHVDGSNNIVIMGATSAHNGYGIHFSNNASRCSTIGNICYDNNLADIRLDTVTDITLDDNGYYSTTPISQNGALSDILLGDNNNQYKTSNSGYAAIANGTTSIVVNHGLSVTPNNADIVIARTNVSTNDIGIWYVDPTTYTATQFTIRCVNDPGASGAGFTWHARKRRLA